MPFAGAIADFARCGFTDSLSVVSHRLRVLPSARTFGPQGVVMRSYRRFEGVSDPDDTAMVDAIETEGGIRGTLADAYGVYADPAISAFLIAVNLLVLRPRGSPGHADADSGRSAATLDACIAYLESRRIP